MSEKVVFSQLSRNLLMRTMPRPPSSRWSITAWRLVTTSGLSIAWKRALTCPWDEYLAWIATLEAGSEARRKWKACRNMVRSSSTLTMCRCWPTHSIKPGQRKLRSSRNRCRNAAGLLHDIHQENAIYLMVRRLRD
ncbi:formate hydrogenlyase maturation HycH family protein [Escherichia coli]